MQFDFLFFAFQCERRKFDSRLPVISHFQCLVVSHVELKIAQSVLMYSSLKDVPCGLLSIVAHFV